MIKLKKHGAVTTVLLMLLLTLIDHRCWGATSLNSTLLMFSLDDAEKCPARVNSYVKGNARLQFLPTLYYLQAKNKVESFCSMQNGRCRPFNSEIIKKYEDAWTACFSVVAAQGIGLSVLPHLDDGSGKGEWRNKIVFDSLKRYKGYSYYDIMLAPLARTLTRASRLSAKQIDLALMGEMGAPIFAHPESALGILYHLKLVHPSWQIGLSFNHNGINGEVGKTRKLALQALINASDFIGMSEYHAVHAPASAADFVAAVVDFRLHFRDFGVTVPDTKPIHFSEIGLGGGFTQHDGTIVPAVTAAQVAASPWAGFQLWPYDMTKDPWQVAELRDFRRQFYHTLLDFLARPTQETRVVRAFNWNDGPWNFQNYEPNVYADEIIQESVEQHNLKTQTTPGR